MTITNKLHTAEIRTQAWSRGLPIIFPDNKEWQEKIINQNRIFFTCEKCGQNFSRIIMKGIIRIRICSECWIEKNNIYIRNKMREYRKAKKLSTG